jgi:hypothetical protein
VRLVAGQRRSHRYEAELQVAAGAGRPGRRADLPDNRQPASRTVSDAQLINLICDARFTTDVQGRRPLAAEGP